ncbi:MAG: ribonuclease HII [Ignavibacteria bacterium]|nr:ribonuclease HII [Ignavibacteria bacterium]
MTDFDDSYRTNGATLICGVDEAGRGPLAGPVVAAAVLFAPGVQIEGINDSKKISEKKREYLFPMIIKYATAYSVSVQPIEVIEKKNILGASLFAMEQAVGALSVKPHVILLDGNKVFREHETIIPVVKGDAKSFSIAAASILAKVTRDRIMDEYDALYPQYHWKKNKGYPTREHIRAILEHGACPYHRPSFLKNISNWEQGELFK